MKSNKLTNLFKKDISFLGHAKYYFVALAAILISAIIIVSVIGMKIGFDFQGGTIVEVVYGVEFDDEGNPYPEDSQYTKDLAKEKIEWKLMLQDIHNEVYMKISKLSANFEECWIF